MQHLGIRDYSSRSASFYFEIYNNKLSHRLLLISSNFNSNNHYELINSDFEHKPVSVILGWLTTLSNVTRVEQ